MDAVKFIKERKRMCNGRPCATCPLFAVHQLECLPDCKKWCMDHPEASVTVVEKWAEEHRKTRQSEFLKQWPNAKMNPFTGTIDVPPCYLDKSFLVECREHTSGCHDCRRKYWLKEVE